MYSLAMDVDMYVQRSDVHGARAGNYNRYLAREVGREVPHALA